MTYNPRAEYNINEMRQSKLRRIKELLETKINIPYVKIECYGKSVVVTAKGYASAEKWQEILSKFTEKQKIVESTVENIVNMKTVLNPSQHKQYLILGQI